MIISIKPWLELADGAETAFREGDVNFAGLELSSNAEMEELLSEAAALDDMGSRQSLKKTLERMDPYHEPVLAREVIEALQPAEGKQFFDGTLGGGGHSELLLANGAHVIGSDQDLDAIDHVTARLAGFGDRFLPLHGNFSRIDQLLGSVGIDRVDGILLDLGVSSHQLDEGERGFSFHREGPLDMRMNQGEGETAADLVNSAEEDELAQLFREYGEERQAGRVARAIVKARGIRPFERTGELAQTVESVIPKTGKNHPATRVFQALRIAVNDELGCLERALEKSVDHLEPGGILAVITFHSLEDRIVKQFMRKRSEEFIDRPEWPEPRRNPDYCLTLPHRKPRSPGDDELEVNPRSRSAKLRVAKKI